MATITVPTPVGPLPAMESTPAGAAALAGDLRAVTTAVKDVQSWAQAGSGGEWAGEAEESSHHARTRFAVRLEGGEAALLDAVVAADRFEDRLHRLEHEQQRLDDAAVALNGDIATLRGDIVAATGSATPADVEALRHRADRLQARVDALDAEMTDWQTRYGAVEDDFVAALRALDTVAEGRAAADEPGLPDPDDLVGGLVGRAGDPVAVAAWWRALTRAQQQALMTEYPEVVGNTAGIPVDKRDQANRAYLAGRLDYLGEREADGELTDAERSELERARKLAQLLDEYRNRVDPTTGDNLLNVIGYRPNAYSGDGGVILGLGNPDTADHVATYVPGTTSEGGELSGFDRVETLYADMGDEDRGSVAGILWLDYDAPSADSLTDLDELGDLGSVVTTGEARDGGERLADFLDGLDATDRGAPEDMTVIGHSYGATTAAYGAQDGGDLDQLVLLGSPGAPASTATGLTGGEVYVGAADYDPITLLGLGARGGVGALGYDPAQESFGATRFDVDPGSYQVEDLIRNHSSYFQGESLDNITDIATGGVPSVDDGRSAGGDGSYQNLSELLAGSSAASGADWLGDRTKDIGDSLLRLAHPHP